jgi:hypothetical protein
MIRQQRRVRHGQSGHAKKQTSCHHTRYDSHDEHLLRWARFRLLSSRQFRSMIETMPSRRDMQPITRVVHLDCDTGDQQAGRLVRAGPPFGRWPIGRLLFPHRLFIDQSLTLYRVV